jgi:hypothetical protein
MNRIGCARARGRKRMSPPYLPGTQRPRARSSGGGPLDVPAPRGAPVRRRARRRKKGPYEFYCSVPGHEQAGMKGTLTVK